MISSGVISRDHRHVAGDEDHRAVFAERAREGQREAGQQRRHQRSARSRGVKVCQRRRAERGGGFLELLLQVFQHRLQRAHDERQADEDQRDEDAERREADLERQLLADPAVAG